MHSDERGPGYKARPNKDGTVRHVWVARADLVKKGYRPKTVRLHYDGNTADGRLLIAAACRRLQAEMLAWHAGYDDRNRFDGTVAGLIKRYQNDPESPHQSAKWNTQRTDNQVMGIMERAFGKRALSALKLTDFRRWYDEAAKAKTERGKPRIRKAYGIIKMMRQLVRYGIAADIGLIECKRLIEVLNNTRFKQPGRRRIKLALEHVQAFVPRAVEMNRRSLAIGTVLQFETGMRQRDIIGEWAPLACNDAGGGIVLRGRRWQRGLTWSDLSTDFIIAGKETTKTGTDVSHDLKLMPMVMDLLRAVPQESRVGPLIIDEIAGRPYAEHAFAREWRVVARAAGIPDTVWNMDARSGAISEAEDAGATLDEISGAVGHTLTSTTKGYIRGAIGKSRKVAELRQAHRKHDVNN